ncbi:MAG: hypothetical protein LQ339_008717, partial [Xanthoria mediterranea]
GTCMEFLIQDANVTRKAFMRWWIEDYLKSSHGKALPKAVKTEIKGLIEARPPNPISRESLLPGTVSVIQTWESIPLVPGSVEWAKARVRLIRDMYQRDEGQLDHYRSLAQPWSYKDIEWSNEGPVTKLADPTMTTAEFPPVPANPLSNPNRLRISVDDFELRLLSLYISTPEEQLQQQQPPPQQHPAETHTVDVSNRAMEASTEEVVVQQQQHHVKKEHAPKGVIDGVIAGQSHVREEHAREAEVEVDGGIIQQLQIKNGRGEEEDDGIEIIASPHVKKEHAGEKDVEITGAATQQSQIKNERGKEEDAEVEIIEPPHIKAEHGREEESNSAAMQQPQIKKDQAPQEESNSATTQHPHIKKERLEKEKEAGAGDSDLEIVERPVYRD